MGKIKYQVDSAEFGEFVFNYLSNVPKDKILELNDSADIAIFRSTRTIRKFSFDETLDRRLCLLVKLGLRISLGIMPDNLITDSVELEVITQNKFIEKRLALIEKMRDNFMFYISSAEIMMSMQMMAQNSHSVIYQSSLAYNKVPHVIRQMNKGLHDVDYNNTKDGIKIMSKVILNVFNRISDVELVTELKPFEFMLLLALVPYRETFISVDKVQEILNRSDREKGTAKSMSSLESKGFIYRSPGYNEERNKEKLYAITANGIRLVMNYMRHIMFGI